MKKKLLLIISMFLFIFNVKALTFNVDVTDIEYTGNNGTIGSVESIDLEDRKINAFFQDIGDEVSFKVTITNSGDRAGTLRSIDFEYTGNSIEYTTDLPSEGLSINGNDTNFVNITARVKEGAVNGNTSSEIKLTYKYDEGSCPEGEILSDDESMCLCPEGKERNETGKCVKPETPVECADDEIYNSEKKICEKKEITPPTPVDPDEPDTKPVEPEKPIPKVVPNNPKTLDNIVLITLLFIVSGLGIYAAMYKKLNTDKKKITVGAITGVVTFTLSFTVLAGVFGIDNLLGAIVNPITKTKQLVIKVNERIDLIETWDGECSVETSELTPENIFEGGSGTEEDPYKIKTAEQLSCFAASVNNGNRYEGKFVKQIKNIKLNDHLNDQATANDLSNAHMWIPIGYDQYSSFKGTYDGNNFLISGLYLNPDSNTYDYLGFFGNVENSTIKNISLSDIYITLNEGDDIDNTGSLIAFSSGNLLVENVITYGRAMDYSGNSYNSISGVVSKIESGNDGFIKFENVENNVDITCINAAGIVYRVNSNNSTPDIDTIIFKNVTNNGNINIVDEGSYGEIYASGVVSRLWLSGRVLFENAANTGNFNVTTTEDSPLPKIGGIAVEATGGTMINSYNTGTISSNNLILEYGGLIAEGNNMSIIDSYNSGNMNSDIFKPEGVDGDEYSAISSAYGSIGGLASQCYYCNIHHSYNTGTIISGYGYTGGLLGYYSGEITDSYNLGNVYGVTDVGGLAGQSYDGTINNSYNKGNIILWAPNPHSEYTITMTGGLIGGDDYSGNTNEIYNSFNDGDVISLSKILDQNSIIAGISPNGYGVIQNSYNRGNLISKNTRIGICGLSCGSETITNSYNSGNISFENTDNTEVSTWWQEEMYIGICRWCTINNSYNLGNITANDDGGALGLGGNEINNSVNKGNITLTFNSPLTSQREIYIHGITSQGSVNNCFNDGTISLVDNTDDHTTTNPDLNHIILIGEIKYYSDSDSSGNKFTNQSGYALSCYSNNECTLEDSEAVGTYTTEEAPGILSIINGDGAYNDTLDESGLPTLKVFNN